ncbi:hypothetical protein FO519_005291 [Halicephalobus sp. NKZ332]|nr:hypothetical protein FO519_005291 [Halicephalobus sp. NKZ332]
MGKPEKKRKSKVEFTEDYRPIRKVAIERKNDAPKPKDIEQLVPRRIREIQQLNEAAKLPKQKRKFKQKNSMLQLAEQYGFQKKIGEDEEQLKKRMLRETTRSIDHEMFKAWLFIHRLCNLDFRHKDYEELDEKARRKKALKILRAEKRAKLRAKNKDVEDTDEEKSDSASDDLDDKETKSRKKERQEESKPSEPKKKRLTKNERLRLLKKEEKEVQDRELMLHAREIIPFGERVDAPPEFKGKLKNIADPSAKAGAKDLLLKRVLESNSSTKNHTSSDLPKSKVSNEERQNVIKMYRQLKKKKL